MDVVLAIGTNPSFGMGGDLLLAVHLINCLQLSTSGGHPSV
jgi:hypothetical protein